MSTYRQFLYESNLCLMLDKSNNLQICKNKEGFLDHLNNDQAIDLITKIMFNSFYLPNDNMKLFVESIKQELIESYQNIFKKYKIDYYYTNLNNNNNNNNNNNKEFKVKELKSANDTSLKGYLYSNYYEIESIFGKPTYFGSGDNKIDWRWILEIDNSIITIYNYKDGPSYLKDKSITEHDITSWHIGGKDSDVLNILTKYFPKNHIRKV